MTGRLKGFGKNIGNVVFGGDVMKGYCSIVEMMMQVVEFYVNMFPFFGLACVRRYGNDAVIIDHHRCSGDGESGCFSQKSAKPCEILEGLRCCDVLDFR